MRSGMLDPAPVTGWLPIAGMKPGRARHFVPSTWVSQDPLDPVALEVSRGRPAVRTMHHDGSLAVGQVAELAADHTEHVLVEEVELLLGAGVAGVATTGRHPGDLYCRVTDTNGDSVDVDTLERRIGNHEWQAVDTTRHEPVNASAAATPIGRPSPITPRSIVASPRSTAATHHASARAGMIRHFRGSRTREYSSSRGARFGCGSGKGSSPCAVIAKAPSTTRISSSTATTASPYELSDEREHRETVYGRSSAEPSASRSNSSRSRSSSTRARRTNSSSPRTRSTSASNASSRSSIRTASHRRVASSSIPRPSRVRCWPPVSAEVSASP